MKPLVIYHANCADGYGAAFAAWLVLGDEAEYVPCQYGKQAEEFMTSLAFDREVYILDFSFPKNVMNEIFRRAEYVVLLDHHKTAFETYDKNPAFPWRELDSRADILLNSGKSGAVLAWEYFHPEKTIPMFIRLIDTRDRWVFEIPGAKEFNAALWSIA